jgi:hypothetical protein
MRSLERSWVLGRAGLWGLTELVGLVALAGHVGCAPPPPAIPTLPPPPVRPVASAPVDESPPSPKEKAAPVETAKDDDPEHDRLVAALGALRARGDDAVDLTGSAGSLTASGSSGGIVGGTGGLGAGSGGPGGAGTVSGFGRLGSGSGTTVTLRQGATQVVGRLPPEVIQRIVRMNFGRMRLCYETALRTNPKLAGRASVRFVIGPSGAVASSAPGPTDFAPPALQACLAAAFRGMSFPQPDGGGSVTVVYPVHFTSTPPAPAPTPPAPRAPTPPPPKRP